jgi:hypothetical protein
VRVPNTTEVTTRPQKQEPPRSARRPPEPLRPEPARKPGVTLLAAKARRRRYRIGGTY